MRERPAQAGFTLTEIMVGMVIVGVMGIGMVSMFRVQHQTYVSQNSGVLSTQNARAGLDMMVREMRNAGFDPYGDAGAGVTEWTATRFAFTADLNGDGDTDDPDESVTYFFDAADSLLVRSVFGTDATLANGIAAMTFSYFRDGSGTAASSASGIEQVRIRMTYATPEGVLDGSLETQVALRNNIY